jgi:hypothetical protein
MHGFSGMYFSKQHGTPQGCGAFPLVVGVMQASCQIPLSVPLLESAS